MRVQVDLDRSVSTRALPLLMSGCLGLSSNAWAAGQVLEEIVVTAEKRESDLQKYSGGGYRTDRRHVGRPQH